MGAGTGSDLYCGAGHGALGGDHRGIRGDAGVESRAVLSGYVGPVDGRAPNGTAGGDCAGGVGTGGGGVAVVDGSGVDASGIAAGGVDVAVRCGAGAVGDELVSAENAGDSGLIFQRRRAYNRGMDGVELLPVEIAKALERGATVVTGNQRAARALRRGFDQRNRERGLASWAPPPVIAWDAWMAALWQGLVIEGHAAQMLLNRTQEHVVWRAILEADEELASLRTVDSLAEIVADAWRLVCRYEGQRRLRGSDGSADTRAFQRWARTFERLCEAEGFLAQAQLEEGLRDAVDNGLVGLPAGEVVLVGFDGMTPAQTKLIKALRSAGVDVEELRLA